MLDFNPPVTALLTVIDNITDDQLGGPTPCEDTSVGGLLDHVMALTVAFTVAAEKSGAERLAGESAPGEVSLAHLHPRWRDLLPERLAALAAAWRDPAAWDGTTEAGGVTLAADEMGAVAHNELVIHGWDLARATGQDYAVGPASARAAHAFSSESARQAPEGTPGMFGPPVDVPADAALVDRAIAYSGRNPAWTP